MERLPAEEDRLTEAQVVDPADVGGPEGPLQVRGVAARDAWDADPGDPLDRGHEVGQGAHVAITGHHAALTGQVRADPGEAQGREAFDLGHHAGEVGGQDPFAEIAGLDHKQDAVDPTLGDGGLRQAPQHGELGVGAHVGVGHDPVDLAEHGGAEEGDRGGHTGPAQGLDVLDAGVAEAGDPGGDQLVGDGGRAHGPLGDRGDLDAPRAEALDERAGVVTELGEVDLQAGRHHRAPAVSSSPSWGKAASTMATSSAVGRVSASVAGMPSSAS